MSASIMKSLCAFTYTFHGLNRVYVNICQQSLKHKVTNSRHALPMSLSVDSVSVLLTSRNQTHSCHARLSRVFTYGMNILNQRQLQPAINGCHSARWYCSTNDLERQKLDAIFPLRYIYVHTSITRWEDIPHGVVFDVGYVDSTEWNKNNSSSPVILGIPDVVGDHNDLTSVLKPFAIQGYRVIIVNLPGTSLCKGKSRKYDRVYQMSVSEHTEFISDFLHELKIDRVNMVVTNGHSVYTGVSLCVVHKDIFHSLAMINPTGLQYTKIMNFPRLHKWIAHGFEQRELFQQWVVRTIVCFIKRLLKKADMTTLEVITYSRNISVLAFNDEENRASQLKSRDKPLLACYGEDSKSLDVESTKAYLSLMGIPESSFFEVQDEKQQLTKGNLDVNSLAFHIRTDSGSILENNTVFIRRRLWNFLKRNNPDL